MPDLTVLFAGGPRPPMRGLIEVPPTIGIEVVSASPRDEWRDRVEKLVEYAAFGSNGTGSSILSSGASRCSNWGRTDGTHTRAAISEGVIDPVPGCEGLRFDVSALRAEPDALSEALSSPRAPVEPPFRRERSSMGRPDGA
jgi:hypothetical protein